MPSAEEMEVELCPAPKGSYSLSALFVNPAHAFRYVQLQHVPILGFLYAQQHCEIQRMLMLVASRVYITQSPLEVTL